MRTKEYRRPMKATWWMHNRHVFLFMVRELTSVFVFGYAVFLLVLLYRSNHSREAFDAFFERLRSPGSVVLHLVALAMVAYHSVTSFNAAPQIMVVQRGEDRVPPGVIVGGNYALWLIVSVVVLILVL